MKSVLPICLSVVVLSAAVVHGQQPVPTGEFTKIQLTDQFWAEGAAIGDFNHDGKMAVLVGRAGFQGAPHVSPGHREIEGEKSGWDGD